MASPSGQDRGGLGCAVSHPLCHQFRRAGHLERCAAHPFARVPAFCHSAHRALHGERRYRGARQSARQPGAEHAAAGHRHGAGQRHGHHRGGDADGASGHPRQRWPQAQRACAGVFHLSGGQCRRCAHPARRSAAISRLSQGRGFFLDAQAPASPHGFALRPAAGDVLCARPLVLEPGGRASGHRPYARQPAGHHWRVECAVAGGHRHRGAAQRPLETGYHRDDTRPESRSAEPHARRSARPRGAVVAGYHALAGTA